MEHWVKPCVWWEIQHTNMEHQMKPHLWWEIMRNTYKASHPSPWTLIQVIRRNATKKLLVQRLVIRSVIPSSIPSPILQSLGVKLPPTVGLCTMEKKPTSQGDFFTTFNKQFLQLPFEKKANAIPPTLSSRKFVIMFLMPRLNTKLWVTSGLLHAC